MLLSKRTRVMLIMFLAFCLVLQGTPLTAIAGPPAFVGNKASGSESYTSGHPGLQWNMEASTGQLGDEDEEIDRDENSKEENIGEHPSLKGLRNALNNAVRNNVSPMAISVLQKLIESRQNLEEVIEEIEEEAADEEEHVNSLIEVGDALAGAGQDEDAEKAYEKAASIAPGDEKVQRQLDNFYRVFNPGQFKSFVKGKKLDFDVPPKVENNRVLVPARALVEALGAEVEYNKETRIVKLTLEGKEIILMLGSDTAIINGQEVQLDAPAQIDRARTVVPLRFVNEQFNLTVKYFPASKLIII